jgi:hypothetical protein
MSATAKPAVKYLPVGNYIGGRFVARANQEPT